MKMKSKLVVKVVVKVGVQLLFRWVGGWSDKMKVILNSTRTNLFQFGILMIILFNLN